MPYPIHVVSVPSPVMIWRTRCVFAAMVILVTTLTVLLVAFVYESDGDASVADVITSAPTGACAWASGVSLDDLAGLDAVMPNMAREKGFDYRADVLPATPLRALKTRYAGADSAARAVIEADLLRLFGPRHAKEVLSWLNQP